MYTVLTALDAMWLVYSWRLRPEDVKNTGILLNIVQGVASLFAGIQPLYLLSKAVTLLFLRVSPKKFARGIWLVSVVWSVCILALLNMEVVYGTVK